ncbi:MAG: hypothetical protein UY50_C0029G0014 [Parcubacteria group bacterium GW2011_GWA2_49_9]|nr:MAG: hypothetical protein UY50_C0029G0014 [Parcubacteria group bacterium GW2011_GWA2_49_9]
MSTISLSKKQIQKDGGVVVLSLAEYKKLSERAVPEYYLTGKAARDLDTLVKEGLRDYESGKCRKIKSLGDLD